MTRPPAWMLCCALLVGCSGNALEETSPGWASCGVADCAFRIPPRLHPARDPEGGILLRGREHDVRFLVRVMETDGTPGHERASALVAGLRPDLDTAASWQQRATDTGIEVIGISGDRADGRRVHRVVFASPSGRVLMLQASADSEAWTRIWPDLQASFSAIRLGPGF